MRAAAALLFTSVLSAQHYPNTSNAAVWMGALGFAPPSIRPNVATWAKQRYDVLKIGALTDTGANEPNTHTTTYTDIAVAGPSQLYDMRAYAESAGYDFESIMIHSSRDMQWSPGFTPANENKFDRWDFNAQGFNQNGLLLYDGAAYSDATNSSSWTIANTLYVGYMVPFDQINFRIATARVGGSAAFKYWNGSTWAAISTTFADTTSGLTATGKASWYPPLDWTRTTVNGSRSKYWVQITITGASTAPAASSIKGDDWTVASGSNNCRGWGATDANRINVGTALEYNPNPPADATAKFRYQARVPTNFWNGNVYINESYSVAGARPAGKYLVYDVSLQITPPYNFSGAFYDDAGRLPNVDGVVSPPSPMQYFDISQSPDPTTALYADQAAMYQQMIADLHTVYGPGFWVGTNSQLPVPPNVSQIPSGSQPYGNFALVEGYITPDSHDMFCHYDTINGSTPGRWCPYDWGLPANNAGGVKFYFQAWDRWAFDEAYDPYTRIGGGAANTLYSTYHHVDNANRTPMAVLALHYLGANANNGFSYFASGIGWNGYYLTDEVYTKATPTTLTADVTRNVRLDQPKTFSLASKANCANAGRYLYLDKGDGTGELVQGMYGRVIYAGSNVTWDVGTNTTNDGRLFNGWPNQIEFLYSQKFGSLSFTFVTPAATSNAITVEYWNGTAWTALTVTDGTNQMRQNGTITWTVPADWATKAEQNYSPLTSALDSYTGYPVRLTTYQQFTAREMTSSEWLTLDSPTLSWGDAMVYQNYTSGAAASCVRKDHLSQVTPTVSQVYAWTRWFPAMGTDLGSATGARQIPWKTGGAPDNISGQTTCPNAGEACSDVWRRDFSKAIVLFRPYSRSTANRYIESEIDTPSKPIALGGTYYPLRADGTTGPGVTSIVLRGGEGAILMSGEGTQPAPDSGGSSGAFSGGWLLR